MCFSDLVIVERHLSLWASRTRRVITFRHYRTVLSLKETKLAIQANQLTIEGDVTFKRWEGLYHETHNEPEKAEVMQTMVVGSKAGCDRFVSSLSISSFFALAIRAHPFAPFAPSAPSAPFASDFTHTPLGIRLIPYSIVPKDCKDCKEIQTLLPCLYGRGDACVALTGCFRQRSNERSIRTRRAPSGGWLVAAPCSLRCRE